MDREFIETAAARVVETNARRRTSDQVRLLNAGLIRAKASAYWEALRAEVSASVDEFNRLVSDESLQVAFESISDRRFCVSGKGFPYPKVKVFFNVPGHQVELAHENSNIVRHAPLQMAIDPEGFLVVGSKRPADIAKDLLSYVFPG